MPSFRINALRVPVVSLLLLLLLYSPPVACKTNDVLPSSVAATVNADDNLLLGDSESLSISPFQTSNNISLEVSGDDDSFSFTSFRPSCADNGNVSASFWFGNDGCKMRFDWTGKYFSLVGRYGLNESISTTASQTISLRSGQAGFKVIGGKHRSVQSCEIKRVHNGYGKKVVHFWMEAQSNLECVVKVEFPSGYKRYVKPTEAPTTESQTTEEATTTAESPSTSVSSSSGLQWWIILVIVAVSIVCVLFVLSSVAYLVYRLCYKKKRSGEPPKPQAKVPPVVTGLPGTQQAVKTTQATPTPSIELKPQKRYEKISGPPMTQAKVPPVETGLPKMQQAMPTPSVERKQSTEKKWAVTAFPGYCYSCSPAPGNVVRAEDCINKTHLKRAYMKTIEVPSQPAKISGVHKPMTSLSTVEETGLAYLCPNTVEMDRMERKHLRSLKRDKCIDEGEQEERRRQRAAKQERLKQEDEREEKRRRRAAKRGYCIDEGELEKERGHRAAHAKNKGRK